MPWQENFTRANIGCQRDPSQKDQCACGAITQCRRVNLGPLESTMAALSCYAVDNHMFLTIFKAYQCKVHGVVARKVHPSLLRAEKIVRGRLRAWKCYTLNTRGMCILSPLGLKPHPLSGSMYYVTSPNPRCASNHAYFLHVTSPPHAPFLLEPLCHSRLCLLSPLGLHVHFPAGDITSLPTSQY